MGWYCPTVVPGQYVYDPGHQPRFGLLAGLDRLERGRGLERCGRAGDYERCSDPVRARSTITVPANARPGTTYARFRYGKEGNLGPTGASTREGEVEDYRIDILSLQPVAVDDFQTVEQSSQNNVFNVLANDVPGASGRANMRLLTIDTRGASGTAVIDDNGTPNIFTDDFIRYTPGPGATGTDSFTYTIRDEVSGLTSTARVHVTIVPFFGNFPFAVDDSYWLSLNQTVADLFVLRNDLPGPTRSISIPANGIDAT
jgi:hypothetical protein